MPTQKEIVDAVAAQLVNQDLSKQAVMVLHKSTETILNRIQQNVNGQLRDDSSPIVEDFVKTLAEKLTVMSQAWHSGETNELTVFPEGTRFVFRDGSFQTIVVEQPPQVRMVTMNWADGGDSHARRHVKLLAFPYVQFVVGFQRHRVVQKLAVSMTKKPITDLDRPLMMPTLCNITKHYVCMGGDFPWPQDGTMTDATNAVISRFWGSEFTGDASEYYKNFLADNNIRSLAHWEQKTKEDPLFVVAKETKYRNGSNLRGLLYKENNAQGSQTAFLTGMKQEIVNSVGAIGGEINAILTSLDLKTENREKSHIQTLEGILKEIIVQAYAELWEFLQKQLLEERTKLRQEMAVAAEKLKNDFVYASDKKKSW